MNLVAAILSAMAFASLAHAGTQDPSWCAEPGDRPAHCDRRTHGLMLWPPHGKIPFSRRYNLTVADVPRDEIPEICDRLWWGLNRWGMTCDTWSHGDKPYCRAASDNSTTLEWWFETSMLCDPWKVHGAWWHATENKYGGVWCCKLD
ncbi:hypothetical protein CkaCkLH20_05155 [Colletotrichum karsti]|uniref:Uncharacterized protein n=1 Tax=Colletotrichum karsti TaxID=1095194 RepID=A0A9P6LLP1_9PEZI|nr:uncharacterized protein CkaCkLH20_05155 [Colletotrichum karsti]KAF9877455.1 hypothetical protein CkaCkLH20_05155 [Colletotrichum karsti]